MKKIELLAPAGNLEKLKIAIKYGADAVYFGGEKFSLRARANNFSLEDIKEGVKFAHKHHAKVYVTTNILPHNDDLDGLVEYLKYLDSVGVDAIIASSMTIINTCIKECKRMKAHISTQMSTLNSYACKFFKDLGATRVVLARECSLDEIKEIAKKTDVELEVFIHGGMCSSYSGRCMLSNHMVNRDANRGGCAHSCRWNYDLYDKGIKINKDHYFNIGSKDLMALKMIPHLIDAGIASLKVEGRMKSEYYIAKIISSYRALIDDYYKTRDKNLDYDKYKQEIEKAENRETSIGFFNGPVTINEQLYDRDDHPTKEYVGIVLKDNLFKKYTLIKQKNFFKIGDHLEIFGPNNKKIDYEVKEIFDCDLNPLDAARHPEQIIKLKVPFRLKKDDMLRLKINIEK